ncbi:hypothetical protein MTR_4g009877 [Medicago truncatula]|uniref:Uncharacterized protein n=1 Tax=Medicago truncatula TaxID=3880 RepID=A0A072UFZ8_MEDTR|nr:hypothetical protein MTR_4g009877 [Medicago truncatula]
MIREVAEEGESNRSPNASCCKRRLKMKMKSMKLPSRTIQVYHILLEANSCADVLLLRGHDVGFLLVMIDFIVK